MKQLVWLVLLVLAGAAGAQTQPPSLANPVVMTVNGEEVRLATVSVMMGNISRQLEARGEEPGEDQLLRAATSQAVDLTLLAQEARRRGVTIDEGEVDKAVAEMEGQAGGLETFTKQLREMGMSRTQLRNDLATSRLLDGLVTGHIIPGITVTDAEVAEFYEANRGAFTGPEQVRARHILRVVEQGARAEDRVAARETAADARERALAGEDFAALARELSQGPSAPRGGDLGFFALEDMVEPFASAAFALEPGEISDVVQTQFGYHVIKVEERREAGERSIDDIREQLRATLVQRRVGEAMAALLEDLRSKAEILPAEELVDAASSPESAGG